MAAISKGIGIVKTGANRIHDRHDGGFTLMELLVSITLMGLIAVAIHSGFRLTLNSWERSERALQRQRTLHFVLDLISRQVGSIVPYYSRQHLDGAPVDVLLFHGSAQGVRFVSSFSSDGRAADGLRLVEYFLADSPNGEGKALLINDTALPENPELVGMVFTSFSRSPDNFVVAEFGRFVSKADSTLLAQDLADAHFEFPRKDKDEDVPPPGISNPMMALFSRKGRASNKRNQLPLGLELKLTWRETGFFHGQEFSIAVPIQAGI